MINSDSKMARVFTGERLETNIYNDNAVKHLHRYAIATKYIQNKIILDIASGEGYGSNLMSEYASFVYGVDIDEETVANAKTKYRKNNLSFLLGSTSKIPLEQNSVDVVISFETIEHHDQHQMMLGEIKRVLKPEGILIISTPDKYYYSDLPNYKNKFHIKELYKEDFIKLINNYFSTLQILSQSYLNGNSLMLDEDSRKTIQFEKGNFTTLKEVECHPVFLIAIASNNDFSKQPNSIFDGSSVFQEKQSFLAKQVHNSITYKVGNVILFPLKVIKKLIYPKK